MLFLSGPARTRRYKWTVSGARRRIDEVGVTVALIDGKAVGPVRRRPAAADPGRRSGTPGGSPVVAGKRM